MTFFFTPERVEKDAPYSFRVALSLPEPYASNPAPKRERGALKVGRGEGGPVRDPKPYSLKP